MATGLQPGEVLYTVQPGDNLSAIAERFYGDPAAFGQILEANLGRAQPRGQTLRDARFIYPGWQLVVPDPTQTVYTDPDGQRWYTVRAGDTLYSIARRFGTAVDALLHVNRLPTASIQPGVKLRIPG